MVSPGGADAFKGKNDHGFVQDKRGNDVGRRQEHRNFSGFRNGSFTALVDDLRNKLLRDLHCLLRISERLWVERAMILFQPSTEATGGVTGFRDIWTSRS